MVFRDQHRRSLFGVVAFVVLLAASLASLSGCGGASGGVPTGIGGAVQNVKIQAYVANVSIGTGTGSGAVDGVINGIGKVVDGLGNTVDLESIALVIKGAGYDSNDVVISFNLKTDGIQLYKNPVKVNGLDQLLVKVGADYIDAGTDAPYSGATPVMLTGTYRFKTDKDVPLVRKGTYDVVLAYFIADKTGQHISISREEVKDNDFFRVYFASKASISNNTLRIAENIKGVDDPSLKFSEVFTYKAKISNLPLQCSSITARITESGIAGVDDATAVATYVRTVVVGTSEFPSVNPSTRSTEISIPCLNRLRGFTFTATASIPAVDRNQAGAGPGDSPQIQVMQGSQNSVTTVPVHSVVVDTPDISLGVVDPTVDLTGEALNVDTNGQFAELIVNVTTSKGTFPVNPTAVVYGAPSDPKIVQKNPGSSSFRAADGTTGQTGSALVSVSLDLGAGTTKSKNSTVSLNSRGFTGAISVARGAFAYPPLSGSTVFSATEDTDGNGVIDPGNTVQFFLATAGKQDNASVSLVNRDRGFQGKIDVYSAASGGGVLLGSGTSAVVPVGSSATVNSFTNFVSGFDSVIVDGNSSSTTNPSFTLPRSPGSHSLALKMTVASVAQQLPLTSYTISNGATSLAGASWNSTTNNIEIGTVADSATAQSFTLNAKYQRNTTVSDDFNRVITLTIRPNKPTDITQVTGNGTVLYGTGASTLDVKRGNAIALRLTGPIDGVASLLDFVPDSHITITPKTPGDGAFATYSNGVITVSAGNNSSANQTFKFLVTNSWPSAPVVREITFRLLPNLGSGGGSIH